MLKKREKLEATIQRFIIAALRRASYRSPFRSEALRQARQNRNSYLCSFCSQTFERKEIQIDHKEPVVPTSGWDSWDGFIERLFCRSPGLQVLCKPCHKCKTLAENKIRRTHGK